MSREEVNLFNHVLIVDDDEMSNFVTKTLLEMSGVTSNISIVENGQLACEFLQSSNGNSPSLILLDINMPVMDGFEFLEYYNNNGFNGSTRIVMLTSSARPQDKETAERYPDVVGYVEKPLGVMKIKNLANKILT